MNVAREEKRPSRRRIAAVGMWDGVHRGHRALIDYVRTEAAARSLAPSVVTFGEHPLSVVDPSRRPRLLTDNATRLALLDAAGVADCIMLTFDNRLRCLSAADFLSLLHDRYGVDTLVLGFNNRFGHDRREGHELYAGIGARAGVEVIPAPEYRHKGSAVSSSAIRHLLADGKLKEANELLGRVFTLGGRVTHGRRLGTTMGYPTANIAVADELLVPADGVYACMARTPDGVRRPAMVNIGRRPTVEADAASAPRSIEAHIFDFAGDLYDATLTLEFAGRLRDEKRFDSVGELQRQLATDARRTKKILKCT